ncbi:hypothetical protein G6L30_08300 [Agrobacterium rhizogenes]|nr:hypothetical protein [Rhizobium rhizogenes]
MATNQYLPFATGGGANVLAISAYTSLAARTAGFTAGTALSVNLNTVWRQASVPAAMIGQFVGDIGGYDALDDGSVASLLLSFERTIQKEQMNYAVAGGTPNGLTAALNPVPSALVAGMRFLLKIGSTNNGPAQLNLNGLGAIAITRADGSPLQAADLQAGSLVCFVYDGTNFQIVGLNTSFLPGRNTTVYAVAGTYTFTVPAGVYKIYCISVGAGGGAGGFGVGSSGTPYPAGGGGAGGTALGWINVTPGQSITITIGAGGSGGAASASGSAGSFGNNGSTGGTTSIASFMSATGGSGGGATGSGTFGGVGGLGSGGQINQAGGNGTDGAGGIGSFIYGGNGGASSQGGGGRAATAFSTSVQNGRAPGSGGGSVYNGTWASNGAGGSGADGEVIFQY